MIRQEICEKNSIFGKNIALLGNVMPSQPITNSLLFRNDAQTPLGRLSAAGFLKDSAGVRQTRVLGSYALVYLLEGSGTYSDATGRHVRVHAGDLILIFPEIGHTYGPGMGEGWSEFYCVFDGPVFDFWRSTGLLVPAQPVRRLQPIDYWRAQLQAAVPHTSARTVAERTREISAFLGVLTAILTNQPSEHEPASEPWLLRACALLEADLDQSCDLEALAGSVGMAYETFRKRFANAMGVSPARYRTIRRIDAACVLLQQRDHTIGAIAAKLGFSDEFHFSRRFKQITGLSPRAFRNRLPTL